MNIFFTADTHFSHKNIIKFCKRPFKDINEMNESLISNWNARVSKTDLVYHLGDFGFGDLSEILRRLNGDIILILGSHDKNIYDYKNRFKLITPLLTINLETPITLCHYAMRVWSHSHYNSWHLYGHSHGGLESFGKSYDVGVDNNNFIPISLQEIIETMKKKKDNFNLIKNRSE